MVKNFYNFINLCSFEILQAYLVECQDVYYTYRYTHKVLIDIIKFEINKRLKGSFPKIKWI